MKPPTSEELLQAWREIDADGPQASTTLHLAGLAISDPTLKGVLRRMTGSYVAGMHREVAMIAEGLATGALIYGLNLGIRIGEARTRGWAFCGHCGSLVDPKRHTADECLAGFVAKHGDGT